MTASTVVVDEAGERALFNSWLRAACLQAPPDAACDLAWTAWKHVAGRAHQQPTAPVEAILDAIASLEDRVSETRANIECSDYDDNSELEAYAALTEKRIESLRALLPANKPTGG
jgi:hypothetical protein